MPQGGQKRRSRSSPMVDIVAGMVDKLPQRPHTNLGGLPMASAPAKKAPPAPPPPGRSLERTNTLGHIITERLSKSMLGEFDLKCARTQLNLHKQKTILEGSSSDAMKHFHTAALDYMWQRDAQLSRNWRIRLWVMMEARPTRAHLCPCRYAVTHQKRGADPRCPARRTTPLAWRSF